jgi:tetratricopeptide (TPR) repeat protein
MISRAWAATALFVLAPNLWAASRAVTGPALLHVGVGARAQSLGGATSALSDDVSAIGWNPAGLALVRRPESLLAHAAFLNGQNLDHLGLAFPTWRSGERRVWGVSLGQLAGRAFDVVDGLETVGRVRPRDQLIGLTYAQPWGRGQVGVTMKYVRQDLFETTAGAGAVDAGWRADGGRMGWGVAVMNVGTRLEGRDGGTPLPLLARAGVAWRPAPAWVFLLQTEAPMHDDTGLQSGVEYVRAVGGARVALRGGWRSSPGIAARDGWSLGWGLDRGGWALHYAYLPHAGLGSENRFDATFRWGRVADPDRRRDDRLAEARDALAKDDLSRARSAAEELVALSPRSQVVRALNDEVRRRLADTVDPAVLSAEGRAALARGDSEAAVAAFQKWLLVEPESVEGRRALKEAEAAARSSREIRARREVERVRRGALEDWSRRAREAAARQDWRGALTYWDKILTLDPSATEAQRGRAQCRERLAEVARRLYDEGVRAYSDRDLERARRLFRDALLLAPDDPALRKALDRAEQERP